MPTGLPQRRDRPGARPAARVARTSPGSTPRGSPTRTPREPSSTSWRRSPDVRADDRHDRRPRPAHARRSALARPAAVSEPNATIVEREDDRLDDRPAPRPARRRRPGVPAGPVLRARPRRWTADSLQRPYSTVVAARRGGRPRVPGPARAGRRADAAPVGAAAGRAAAARAAEGPVHRRRRPTRGGRSYVATGTGIAPLLSMLETRLREAAAGRGRAPPDRRSTAPRSRTTSPGWPRLAALAPAGRIAYVPAVSRPSDPANAGWRGAAGRLDGLLPDVLADDGVDPGATARLRLRQPVAGRRRDARPVRRGHAGRRHPHGGVVVDPPPSRRARGRTGCSHGRSASA